MNLSAKGVRHRLVKRKGIRRCARRNSGDVVIVDGGKER